LSVRGPNPLAPAAGPSALRHDASGVRAVGRSRRDTLDNPDGLVEIADWESVEAHAAAVQHADFRV